jgi:hypothetical protein
MPLWINEENVRISLPPGWFPVFDVLVKAPPGHSKPPVSLAAGVVFGFLWRQVTARQGRDGRGKMFEPYRKEIGQSCGISGSTVDRTLKELHRVGVIVIHPSDPGKQLDIELKRPPAHFSGLRQIDEGPAEGDPRQNVDAEGDCAGGGSNSKTDARVKELKTKTETKTKRQIDEGKQTDLIDLWPQLLSGVESQLGGKSVPQLQQALKTVRQRGRRLELVTTTAVMRDWCVGRYLDFLNRELRNHGAHGQVWIGVEGGRK